MVLVPTMRAFCACNLDIASVRRLTNVAEALRARPGAARARWVPATKMHVTLKFFGEIDLGLAGPVADVLGPLSRADAPLAVGFQPLSAFPTVDRARVIMVPLADPTGALAHLAARFDKRVEALGFPPEARPFTPHVTLARLDRPGDVGDWLKSIPTPPEPARLTELVLYRSDHGAPKAEYAALARFPIGPGA